MVAPTLLVLFRSIMVQFSLIFIMILYYIQLYIYFKLDVTILKKSIKHTLFYNIINIKLSP